ncbi:hypothetical protein HK102_001000 [Quaeritorhiza haematococci]|nr:hypothetical protein HK102_001000 [Quaeritorhiza haematococci]
MSGIAEVVQQGTDLFAATNTPIYTTCVDTRLKAEIEARLGVESIARDNFDAAVHKCQNVLYETQEYMRLLLRLVDRAPTAAAVSKSELASFSRRATAIASAFDQVHKHVLTTRDQTRELEDALKQFLAAGDKRGKQTLALSLITLVVSASQTRVAVGKMGLRDAQTVCDELVTPMQQMLDQFANCLHDVKTVFEKQAEQWVEATESFDGSMSHQILTTMKANNTWVTWFHEQYLPEVLRALRDRPVLVNLPMGPSTGSFEEVDSMDGMDGSRRLLLK